MSDDATDPPGADQAGAPPSLYKEGSDSFNQGWPRDDCPYPPESEDREEWLRGWNTAATGAPPPQ